MTAQGDRSIRTAIGALREFVVQVNKRGESKQPIEKHMTRRDLFAKCYDFLRAFCSRNMENQMAIHRLIGPILPTNPFMAHIRVEGLPVRRRLLILSRSRLRASKESRSVPARVPPSFVEQRLLCHVESAT